MPLMPRRFETRCPHCLNRNDRAAAADGKPDVPEDGNALICLRCGGVGIVAGGGLRKPTTAELRELAADPEYLHAAAAVRLSREGE